MFTIRKLFTITFFAACLLALVYGAESLPLVCVILAVMLSAGASLNTWFHRRN